MAKERLASETPGMQQQPQNVEIPPFPTPSPAFALFTRFQKLLRFDAEKKWTYFPLERIEFCRPVIIP